jgi:hypothetical protein
MLEGVTALLVALLTSALLIIVLIIGVYYRIENGPFASVSWVSTIVSFSFGIIVGGLFPILPLSMFFRFRQSVWYGLTPTAEENRILRQIEKLDPDYYALVQQKVLQSRQEASPKQDASPSQPTPSTEPPLALESRSDT